MMTWDELKEKAKELGDISGLESSIILKTNTNAEIEFTNYGGVFIPFSRATIWFAKDKTPEQMLMIMEALQ